MKTQRILKIVCLLLLLVLPKVVQAQDAYSTNADCSIYSYYTNTDGSVTIDGYAGPPWAVIIPTNINDMTVTSIGEYAFSGTSLTSVTIPDSVTSIGDYAFNDCWSLTSVIIPNSVTSIGDNAFYECISLSDVTIPNSVTSIGYQGFFGCNILTNVLIGNSVTNIGDFAFCDCSSLTSVTFGNSVTSIGNLTFGYCSDLTDVTIPNSVTNIGYDAFFLCSSLTNVTILNNVNSIGGYAFGYCFNLASVYFLGNAPSVDSTVFYDDPATFYYLPGTTGWDDFSTNSGLSGALWFLPNPLILNFEPSFGVQTNQFGFVISWATNTSVEVEACTNLANPIWSPVATNTLTGGTSYFSDPQWTNYPIRFYRISSP